MAARSLLDVLSKVRYRGDSFVARWNGRPVARVVPIEDETEDSTVWEVLSIGAMVPRVMPESCV